MPRSRPLDAEASWVISCLPAAEKIFFQSGFFCQEWLRENSERAGWRRSAVWLKRPEEADRALLAPCRVPRPWSCAAIVKPCEASLPSLICGMRQVSASEFGNVGASETPLRGGAAAYGNTSLATPARKSALPAVFPVFFEVHAANALSERAKGLQIIAP